MNVNCMGILGLENSNLIKKKASSTILGQGHGTI